MESFKPWQNEESVVSGEATVPEPPVEQGVAKVVEEVDEGLTPEHAIAQERGLLQTLTETLTGKAKRIANMFLVVSALSAGPGVVSEANAQENKPLVRAEQVEKRVVQEEKINEVNLTESSKWSVGIVAAARADMEKINTAEDAEWFVRSHVNPFVSEYYIPTKGNVKKGPYGISTRDYTQDDLRLLLRNTREIKRMVGELHGKFGIEEPAKRMDQLDDMVLKLGKEASFSGQKQKEALKNMDRFLQQQ